MFIEENARYYEYIKPLSKTLLTCWQRSFLRDLKLWLASQITLASNCSHPWSLHPAYCRGCLQMSWFDHLEDGRVNKFGMIIRSPLMQAIQDFVSERQAGPLCTWYSTVCGEKGCCSNKLRVFFRQTKSNENGIWVFLRFGRTCQEGALLSPYL